MSALKNLNPGVWIAVFFGILIVADVTFYVIAIQNPVQLLPEAEVSAPVEVLAPADVPEHALSSEQGLKEQP